jgi:hypothetical protein
MTKRPFAAGAAILLSGGVLNDPVGHYLVRGTNPNGSQYAGEVLVTRTGDTYRVVWQIGRQTFVGTGIASSDGIAVSYQVGGRTGVALYHRKTNGRWEGVWALAGSRDSGTDVWIPRAASPPRRDS